MGFSNTRWLTLLSEFTRAKGYLGEAGEVRGPVHLWPGLGIYLNAAVSTTLGLVTGRKMISFGNRLAN